MSEKNYHINGHSFSKKELVAFSKAKVYEENPQWEKEIFETILAWFENEELLFHTSGSTGKPKEIFHSRKSIKASTQLTANYFDLNEKSKLLLALPAQYVAGKMMILRALCLGCQLNYVEPSSCPQVSTQYDFASFVPLQMENMLKTAPNSILKINQILLGGAAVHPSLTKQLLQCDTAFFESYGMTETLTHVALRKLGEEAFVGLPNISFKQNKEALHILAPHISDAWIQTNDVVKIIDENSFELLGRLDDVINSGGVKIHPSQVEKKISHLIQNAFYISKRPDERLGEKVCLFIEGEEIDLPDFSSVLEKFEIPKEVVFVSEFERTFSGKVVRQNYR